VSGRSASGRRREVAVARRQSRLALGRDPDQADAYDAPLPKRSTKHLPQTQQPVEARPDESIGVLLVGEAAARLGMSRAELERMIEAGKIKTLPGQFAPLIPSREVERLRKVRLDET
jgi:hypothetical protein